MVSYNRVQKFIMSSCQRINRIECMEIAVKAQYVFPNEQDIWEKDWIGKQIFQSKMADIPTRIVSQFVPENGVLALAIPNDLPVFPFFGEHLTRKLFPVYPPETLLDKSWFQENKIDFLLLHLTDPQMSNPPDWLIPYKTSGDWALYYPEWKPPPTP